MNRHTIYYILAALVLIIAGCNLFSTRNPESPDSGKGNYQPPTSPDILISNFRNSIIELNTENYISCFSDTALGSKIQFRFIPSPDALTLYPGLFDAWDLNSERRSFLALKSTIAGDSKPVLILSNTLPELIPPDSAFFISDYVLKLSLTGLTNTVNYSGSLQMTMIRQNSGLWSVSQWNDTKSHNDTIPETWSIMKARFFN